MEDYLGYESKDRQEKKGENRRNGYSSKTRKTSYGNVPIEVPRDRYSSFEPKVIPKYHKKELTIMYLAYLVSLFFP